MGVDKLTPNDDRVEHHTADIRGKQYHYLLSTPPSGTPIAGTVLLLHGFPDTSFGWRHQIPMLAALNLRVIVPDLLGYGRTAAPDALEAYTIKSMAADMRALAETVCGPDPRIILGGHDWGGALAWHTARWHPQLVHAIFVVCTPYVAPRASWIELQHIIAAGHLKEFTYQLQLAGPDVEAYVGADPARLRQLLLAVYEAHGPQGEEVFSPTRGFALDKLAVLDAGVSSPRLSEAELEFYVDEFSRNGIRGPVNWYRTRRLNYEDDREQAEQGPPRFAMPALFVASKRDPALRPEFSVGMEAHFDSLVRREVDAGHWALWEAAAEVNGYVEEFVRGQIGGERASL